MTDQKLKEDYNRWHKDPNNWKFGIFYYNPDDKRFLPPKRIKYLGWTINFANLKSIYLLIGILFIIITVKFLK